MTARPVPPPLLVREHPPRRAFAFAAVVSLLALAVASVLLTVPGVHEVTVIAAEQGRVRVAGLGIAEVADGRRATLVSGSVRLAATVRDRTTVPDSEATAVVLVLDDVDAPLPDPYTTVQLDLGAQPLAVVLREAW